VEADACPKCLLLLGVAALRSAAPENIPSDAEDPPLRGLPSTKSDDRIGHYKLIEVIGEGAFGTVWMAEQQAPVHRRVALKLIKLGMDSRAVVARFEAERQALAMMDHPGIARVFDGGATEGGRPYFVMELVRGVPLTEFCDARMMTTHERLKLFITVCEAVQHAHQKGIIHRDLKPSNILVTEQDGKPLPKVIDFGIAKATEQQLSEKTLVTLFNQLMGTPAYMSPEQAGLGGLDIDTRTDVYSLGVLLYELVTGAVPFDARKLAQAGHEMIQKTIREVEPQKPSTRLSTLKREELCRIAACRQEEPERLNRLIRGDLDWITLKALEKDRSRRYETAVDLAADLRRYLANEPIVARPAGNLYRLQKLARRHKLAFGAAAAVAAALAVGLIIALWQAARATKSLSQARLNDYAFVTKLAQQALAENDLKRALSLLNRHRPAGNQDDLRGFEWRYLWQLSRSNEVATLADGPCNALAFSPDGALLAYGASNQVIIRDIVTRQVVAHLATEPSSIAFSPRDKLLATAWGGVNSTKPGAAGNVTLWNTETWKPVRSLPGAAQPVRFSPDGAWLATGATNPPGEAPRNLLWRTENWELTSSCAATTELSWQLRNAFGFSTDGSLLATPWLSTIGQECGLKLWKIPTLEPVEGFFSAGHPLCSAAFLPDGRHLLVGTWFGDLIVWDIEKRQIIQTIKENNSGITSVAITAGAKIFATTSHDQRVTVWDSATRAVLGRFRGHLDSIWASAISPDGSVIVTGSFDGTTKLWNASATDSSGVIEHGSLIAGFTPDSRTLVLAPREGDSRWRLFGATQSVVEVTPEPPLVWDYLRRPYDVSGNMPVGVLGRTDGSIELWNLAAGRRTASWRADSNEVTAAAFSPKGDLLASGNVKGRTYLWNTATQTRQADFDIQGDQLPARAIDELVFSPDGRMLAVGTDRILVWDVANLRQTDRFETPHRNVTTIAFAPNGRLLAGASMGRASVYVWDLPSGRRHEPLQGHVTGIVQVQFSPDGKTLATGGYDTVKLWNVATEQEIANLQVPGIFREFCFSPDGRIFAVGYLGYPGWFVRLYHAPLIQEIEAIEAGGKKAVEPLTFSRNHAER
jgi:WD40 repeat protein/serine/threonine protein kinase